MFWFLPLNHVLTVDELTPHPFHRSVLDSPDFSSASLILSWRVDEVIGFVSYFLVIISKNHLLTEFVSF